MNRRSLVLMLVGAIAALSGLLVFVLFRDNRCTSAGGTWEASTGCTLPAGVDPTAADVGITGCLGALAVAFLAGAMLLRIILRLTERRTPPNA